MRSGTKRFREFDRNKTETRRRRRPPSPAQLKNSPSTLLQWPSDDAVAGMWDLHRMPRDKVVEWFQQRRRQDQRRRGAGGSGGGRSGAAQQATTDWDAEWDQEK